MLSAHFEFLPGLLFLLLPLLLLLLLGLQSFFIHLVVFGLVLFLFGRFPLRNEKEVRHKKKKLYDRTFKKNYNTCLQANPQHNRVLIDVILM